MSELEKSAVHLPQLPALGEVLTIKQLAEQWHVSDDTILRLCRDRELSHVKIRGKFLIPVSAAKDYLRKQTTLA